MRAPLQVRFEKLQKLIERISDESQQGRVIVVEGMKDRDSLRSMGVRGRILCLKSSRKNTVNFAEELDGEREVILLTDFDREGVFLAKQLARTLNSQNVQANLLFWRELRGLTRTDLRSIEELPKLYERLHSEVNFRRSSIDLKHLS
ncbi:MAG TPA: toprim domain-containing protein [Candidatus Acidoferrales bacterium]|nr:toprim domain-containing protein [Candidatus Acidoferrales bacterium]